MNNNGNAHNNNASNANGVRPISTVRLKDTRSFRTEERRDCPSMENIVNTRHDAGGYDQSGYKHAIYDGNVLYEAFLKAKKGSDWKGSVQRFEMDYLFGLAKIQKELQEETYRFKEGSSFIIRERGKVRKITGEKIDDRIVKHALCDEVINPAIKKYLIHDNGASQVGKGIEFTRRRLEQHLHQYYRRNGTNKGYILIMDFSKYYDNIRHDVVRDMMKKYIDNPYALRLIDKVLESERVDVSYMTEEEYGSCMEDVFDSLKYFDIQSEKLTGKKYMEKHMNIGNQVAQSVGISYRIPFDNFFKIVKGFDSYAAYMDDSYAIHESKEFLEEALGESIDVAKSIGITVNLKKTRICKLSDMWRFLQIQYSLTDTGRVIHKINPKRLTVMRRKMKKLSGCLTEKEFSNLYHSWFNSYSRYMSKKQRENMDILYEDIKTKHYKRRRTC